MNSRSSVKAIGVAVAAVMSTWGAPSRAGPLSLAPAPAPTPGDTWVYRSVDQFTELETGRRAMTFTTRDSRALVFRSVDLKTLQPSHAERSYALGRCAWSAGIEVCADAYRFPLRIGGTHGYQGMPAGGSFQDLDCVVKAAESVTVPAGTFDAFRVECEGRWSFKTSDFTFRGRLWNSHWYAPAVNNEVKAIYRSYRNNGGIDFYSRNELTEFRPAGSGPGPEERASAAAAADAAATPLPPLPSEFSAGTTRFSGRFTRDPGGRTQSGEGRITWANGDSYDGTLVKGAREGRGAFVWADGQRYEGDWRDDRPSGHGRLAFVNGDRYEGAVEAGAAEGDGIMAYASGDRYVGRLRAGVPDGPGRYVWASGQALDGSWRAGKAHGPALLTFANGDRWDGPVEGDVPHGEGKLLYASGDRYTGRLAAGLADGEGSYDWKSGDRYSGGWKAGLKHGPGRFSWANGDRWDGVFADDRRTEQGVWTRRSP